MHERIHGKPPEIPVETVRHSGHVDLKLYLRDEAFVILEELARRREKSFGDMLAEAIRLEGMLAKGNLYTRVTRTNQTTVLGRLAGA